MDFGPFDFKKDTVEGRMIARLEDALTEITTLKEWKQGATELFNRWLYHAEKGLLSCAKTLARETKVFLKTLEKKP